MALAQVRKIDQELQDWFAEQEGTPESRAAGLAFDLALAIQMKRRELGLKYDDLAARLGVSKAHISKLLGGGENSTLLTLVRLAQAVGCDLELRLVDARERPGVPASDPGQIPAPPADKAPPARGTERLIPRNPRRKTAARHLA